MIEISGDLPVYFLDEHDYDLELREYLFSYNECLLTIVLLVFSKEKPFSHHVLMFF